MVKKYLTTCYLLATLSFLSCAPVSAKDDAKERQDIRFYKINKDEITQKVRFTNRKAGKAGCHNFAKKIRLHRAVQFGYTSCRIYQKKNCPASAIMNFFRDKEPEFKATELTEGYGWYPVGEHSRGEKVKSWFCE